MLLHDIFFWSAAFFLIGIFLASIIPSLLFNAVATLLLISVLLFLDRKQLALLSLILIIGSAYYFVFDKYQQNNKFDSSIVIEAKEHLNYQEIILNDNTRITATRYPEYHYGDQVLVDGKKIKLISHNQGNALKSALIKLRLAFEDNIKKVLPHDKAVFLSGLTVGDITEISPEFKNELKASGTTHLVALSGYNINVIIDNLGWLISFWPTIILIIIFVIMTGAQASLVRAAVMGIIALIARRSQRLYHQRNAITFAAFAMVLFDPKILVFDLGFQLSFLSLLGITYIKPLLEKLTNWKNELVWPTIAAQLAVLPILLIKFGKFNPFSWLANILITPTVPYTMALGFITGTVGFFSYHLSFLAAWFANILLTYEKIIISIFAFNL